MEECDPDKLFGIRSSPENIDLCTVECTVITGLEEVSCLNKVLIIRYDSKVAKLLQSKIIW